MINKVIDSEVSNTPCSSADSPTRFSFCTPPPYSLPQEHFKCGWLSFGGDVVWFNPKGEFSVNRIELPDDPAKLKIFLNKQAIK